MVIQWDEELSVGVTEIDQQHQGLITMVNHLEKAMHDRKGEEVLEELIDNLINYSQTHFKLEEVYFDKFKYWHSATHKKEHAAFSKQVTHFREKFNSKAMGLSFELMTFLRKWLVHHIKDTDKKYSECFHTNGLR